MKPPRPPAPGPAAVRAKFAAARAEMAESLVERADEVDLVLTALLAGEHALLVGPPGCGKSLLLDSALAWAGGARFSALLTRFTAPEELFGPVSLAGLKDDKYRRATAGRLPEADFAFLDEVFRAGGAVLNTLLGVLNERAYDAGDGPRPVPLKLCVAASNAWPDPDEARELAALFDRFLLRKAVAPVRSRAGRSRLLWCDSLAPAFSSPLAPGDLALARAEVAALPWSGPAREALEEVVSSLARQGVRPGDRRLRKSVGAARAYAYLAGAEAVEPHHLEVLRHCLWADPEGEPEKVADAVARVADPPGMRAARHLAEADAVIDSLDPRDLAAAAGAAAKLAEVERRLEALAPDPRAVSARAYVKDQLRRVKLASIEAL